MQMVLCSVDCSSKGCIVSVGALHKPFSSLKAAFQWLIDNQNNICAPGGDNGAI